MNYSLRTFFQTGLQQDEVVGRLFQIIIKEKNPEEFEHHLKETIHSDFCNDIDNVYGLLVSCEVCIPLYKTHKYYVVTENGQTYANISFK